MCFYTIFPTKISDCKSTKLFNTKNINKNYFFNPVISTEAKRSGEISCYFVSA